MTAELEREFSLELRTWLNQQEHASVVEPVEQSLPPRNLWAEYWLVLGLRKRSEERLTMWSAETESSKKHAMQVVATHLFNKAFLRGLSAGQNWSLLLSALRGERNYFLNLWLMTKMLDGVVEQINTKLFDEYGGSWFTHLRMVSDPGTKEAIIRRKDAYSRGQYVELTGDQLRERARRCSE